MINYNAPCLGCPRRYRIITAAGVTDCHTSCEQYALFCERCARGRADRYKTAKTAQAYNDVIKPPRRYQRNGNHPNTDF